EGFEVPPAPAGCGGTACRVGPQAVVAAPPRQHPQGSLLLGAFREAALEGLVVFLLGWFLDLLRAAPSRVGLPVFPTPQRDGADLPGFGQPVVLRAVAAPDDGRGAGRHHAQGFALAVGPGDRPERTAGQPRPKPRQAAATRAGDDLIRAG